jgi:hypothetical protein
MCRLQYTYATCAWNECGRVELTDETMTRCREWRNTRCETYRFASTWRGEGHWRFEAKDLNHYYHEHVVDASAPVRPLTVYDRSTKAKIRRVVESMRDGNDPPGLHIWANLEDYWNRMRAGDLVIHQDSMVGPSTVDGSEPATEGARSTAYASTAAQSETTTLPYSYYEPQWDIS